MIPNPTERLTEIVSILNQSDDQDIRLYLITRKLKPGTAARKNTLEKHTFTAYGVEVDEQLQSHLRSAILDQLGGVINSSDFTVVEYNPLGDDGSPVASYRVNNRTMPFMQVIHDQLAAGVDIPRIHGLGEIKDTLWAFCIGVRVQDGNMVYTFRKASQSKVALKDADNPKGLRLKRVIKAQFNPSDLRLEELDRDTITFDGRTDCLYFDDQFYILEKNRFDQLIGLAEEFTAAASKLLDEFVSSGYFDGIETIREAIKDSIILVKKLAAIAQSEDFRRIDKERLEAMQATATDLKLQFRVQNGQIMIATKEETDVLVKLLMDYYLRSPQTGFMYGASVKHKLTPGKS